MLRWTRWAATGREREAAARLARLGRLGRVAGVCSGGVSARGAGAGDSAPGWRKRAMGRRRRGAGWREADSWRKDGMGALGVNRPMSQASGAKRLRAGAGRGAG